MIINKKYRKWLPIPIIVGIVIIQTVAILSILGYHWLIEKGMIPQDRDTPKTGALCPRAFASRIFHHESIIL